MNDRYPQATVVIPTDAATVYGWNDGDGLHLVIVGQFTEGLRPAFDEAARLLEEDRVGHQWARAMLQKLPEVRAVAQAWRRAKP
jgi:bifunctional DNA-binding transcriptional regulator/antitoxin component of YhaV-PrlF toxin-antitoxin module